ncbi:hypothetical protein [Loigolactobacillus bifermentans]|uniref:Uncharacterized protein n=1 Tax=Loigolactobacillus bifermentans DSM 20003 TaxID=1423726 RepID=A0A0R1GY84_9LACO|nr:hypothetical protein [Loigolactobacillus bifermentans]KRK39118.1 hypothetical protein FC07_GL002839 [Loigolactobacillus bifermentans DSM 20003]QGG58997.1 hypothetical protein LB003_00190 [Loigolactobacillus bifermentans]
MKVKKLRWCMLFIAFFGIFGMVLANGSTDVQAKSVKKSLAKIVNEQLSSDTDLGNMTFKWDKSSESFVATLDPDSTLYQQMDQGQVTIWDSLVDTIKDDSKQIKKKGYSKYSAFQILNPSDKSRTFLQVYCGKVHYNVRDDLD